MQHRPNKPYLYGAPSELWSQPRRRETDSRESEASAQRLKGILKNTSDLTLLSTELKQHCTDGFFLYHLSSARANILRPFASTLAGSRVLEIGADCGAITRYLGECASQVTALEASWAHAEIARSRVRDLDNVTVLTESFDRFRTRQRFDVITLIGGLESASLRFPGRTPELTMLIRARDLLSPGGLLIVAMENPLALQHLKQTTTAKNPDDTARFHRHDRRDLEDLLRQAQFADLRFFSPLPDHKLPATIISEEGFCHPGLDIASLMAQSIGQYPLLPDTQEHKSDLVWPTLSRNGLAMALGNSLMVAAQVSPNGESERKALAWHLHTERRKELCKVTTFVARSRSGIDARSQRITGEHTVQAAVGNLHQVIAADAPHETGQNLHHQLMQVLGRDGWTDGELRNFFDIYYGAIEPWIGQRLRAQHLENQLIDGRFLDAVPKNIVRSEDGRFHLTGTEWRWSQPLPASYLVFRALLSLCTSLTAFHPHAHRVLRTRRDVLLATLDIVGVRTDEPALKALLQAEAHLQTLIGGIEVDSDQLLSRLDAWPASPSSERQHLADQANQVLELRALNDERMELLDERLHLLNDRMQILDDRYRIIQSLKETLRARERWIQIMESSRSWRITQPLRYLNRTRIQTIEWLKITSTHFPQTLELHDLARRRFFAAARLKVGLPEPSLGLCVCIHSFYPDLLAPILERLKACTLPTRVIVTTTIDLADRIRPALAALPFQTELIPLSNRGRDILPFLTAVRHVPSNELILKIHTKRSPHRPDGDIWRDSMLSQLLDPVQMPRTLQAFRAMPDLGMVIPDGHALSVDKYVQHNESWCNDLERRMLRTPWSLPTRLFAGGSMFYVRREALHPIYRLGVTSDDFEAEAGQVDGTLAHAIERLFGVAVATAGYQVSTTRDPFTPASAQSNGIHTL